jgi:hypothetical protein
MFATLLGALPRPVLDGEDLDRLVEVAVRAQEAAGLEPVTDGRLGDPEFERLAALLVDPGGTGRAVDTALEAWHRTSEAATVAAKQALIGPYSVGVRGEDGGSRGSAREGTAREARTLRAAETLAEVIAALAGAGCPLVEIEESRLDRLGDEDEGRLFADAHRRLTETSHGSAIHRSLSIAGASLPGPAIGAVVELPYASVAVDLIAGPDNWYVVRRASHEQGVIAGLLSRGD